MIQLQAVLHCQRITSRGPCFIFCVNGPDSFCKKIVETLLLVHLNPPWLLLKSCPQSLFWRSRICVVSCTTSHPVVGPFDQQRVLQLHRLLLIASEEALRLQTTNAPIYCWHISFCIFFFLTKSSHVEMHPTAIICSHHYKPNNKRKHGQVHRKTSMNAPKKEVCSKMKYKERKLYFCEVCQNLCATSILAKENCLTFSEFFERFYWFSLEVSLDFRSKAAVKSHSNNNKVTRTLKV